MFPAGDEVAPAAVPAGLTLAPIGRRVLSLVLDEIIVAVPAVLIVLAIGFTPGDTVTSGWLVVFNVALIATALVYETVMIAMLGRTVGKIAVGTRVVRLVDGRLPTWSESLIRALVPLSLGAVPRIGVYLSAMCYAMALWTPLRQGLHDKAAGTLVVFNATVSLDSDSLGAG